MTAGTRLAVRVVSELSGAPNGHIRKRTLIYGAGDAGVTLLREIRQNPALAYEIVGFIDDESRPRPGSIIHRATVLGNGADLPDLVRPNSIEMVLIAMPSATGAQMTAVLEHCHQAGVAYKTVPGLAEVIEGTAASPPRFATSLSKTSSAATPSASRKTRSRGTLEGKVVLVTGAAGSIGSELCRQIARFRPAAIVGFEIAESPLFEIDREMRQAFPDVPFHPEIGSIQNRAASGRSLAPVRARPLSITPPPISTSL